MMKGLATLARVGAVGALATGAGCLDHGALTLADAGHPHGDLSGRDLASSGNTSPSGWVKLVDAPGLVSFGRSAPMTSCTVTLTGLTDGTAYPLAADVTQLHGH